MVDYRFLRKLLKSQSQKQELNFSFLIFSDTLDVVKQSAALCLLRLFRTDPSIIPGGEWTSRIIHLLNDQVTIDPDV
jgi:hypothetical protein